jgi:hypothetical protein
MKKYPCFLKKLNKNLLKMSGLPINQVHDNQLNLRARYIFSGQITYALK